MFIVCLFFGLKCSGVSLWELNMKGMCVQKYVFFGK